MPPRIAPRTNGPSSSSSRRIWFRFAMIILLLSLVPIYVAAYCSEFTEECTCACQRRRNLDHRSAHVLADKLSRAAHRRKCGTGLIDQRLDCVTQQIDERGKLENQDNQRDADQNALQSQYDDKEVAQDPEHARY